MQTNFSLKQLVDQTLALAERGERFTHLGICPMSEELIRAPIELAMEHDFPLLFIASRNQVSEDSGGGYVMGLDQQRFLSLIEQMEREVAANVNGESYLRFVSVDHCAPWYKEREKALGEAEAMASVKKTFSACIEAGYAGIHVDCSFPPPSHVEMDEVKMAKMTADLVEFAESQRQHKGQNAIGYEIGTEETAGSSVSASHFCDSTEKLTAQISSRGLPKPVFVVGRTGAMIEMLENTGGFDYTAASELPAAAREMGIGFKEHNADYLSDEILALHPEFGITAANVGPSFAAAQTRALLRLAALEQRQMGTESSNLYNVMSQAILHKAPFKKWLRRGDDWTADRLNHLPTQLQAVTMATGHYVYTEPEVSKAIECMYSNLERAGTVGDARVYVMSAVKDAIMRYVDAFNLRGASTKILRGA